MEKSKIRVLIVEDEGVARERLRRMLNQNPDFTLIRECASAPEGIQAIHELKPDLLLLDVQMPGMDGFQMLGKLPEDSVPYIVFVTAHDQYALSAFDVYALDYILKPFDEERFNKALKRAQEQIEQNQATGIQELVQQLKREMRPHLERFVIKRDGRVRMIACNQVDFLESEGKYVRLYIGDQSHLIRAPIGYLEKELNPKTFIRIHRCFIVNIERIAELQLSFHGDYKVLLKGGKCLTLSRGYRERVSGALGWSI